MPTFVSYPYVIRDGSITPGQHASFLGKAHDPVLLHAGPQRHRTSAAGTEPAREPPLRARCKQRRELQKLIDHQARLLDHSAAARGLDEYYDKALAMLQLHRLRDAFNLSPRTGRGARRLRPHDLRPELPAGPAAGRGGNEVRHRLLLRQHRRPEHANPAAGTRTGSTTPACIPIVEKYHLPITEQTLPTLLNDLETRGLLDTTLVVWMGEFGRTPKINDNVSRDHWPQCYTALLAGGGVKRGFVYGASDKTGAYPADKPVRPDDLAATIYHLLGIDPHTEVRNTQQRPVLIAEGKPVLDVLA